jgi:hypothetical protein
MISGIELRYYQYPDYHYVWEDADGNPYNKVAPGACELQYRVQRQDIPGGWGPWTKVQTVMGDS